MNFRHITVLTLGLMYLTPGHLNASLSDNEDDNGVATQSAHHNGSFDVQDSSLDTSELQREIESMALEERHDFHSNIKRSLIIKDDAQFLDTLLDSESEESVSSFLACLKLLIPNFPRDFEDTETKPRLRRPLLEILNKERSTERRLKLATLTNNILNIGGKTAQKPILWVLYSLQAVQPSHLDLFMGAVLSHLNVPVAMPFQQGQAPHTLRTMASPEALAGFIRACEQSINKAGKMHQRKGIDAMRESSELCTGMQLDLAQRQKLCAHIGSNCGGDDIPYEQFAAELFPREYVEYKNLRSAPADQGDEERAEQASRKRAREESQTQADDAHNQDE